MLGGKKRQPIVAIHNAHSEGVGVVPKSEDAELYAILDDLIEAIHAKNPVEAAHSLKAFFALLEEAPHREGPHLPLEEV